MRQKIASLLILFCAATLVAETRLPSGSGSGFFITADGYFLTNYHVVKGADKIQILVGDGFVDVKLIKTDPANDIAILRAEGQFAPLPIATTYKPSIGDDVFTIGFPAPLIQGFAPKLTKGNINAATGLRDDPRFFQISIPIQPGNSGGPLVDERGNAVGIVTSTLSPTVAMSEGFIPQNVNYAVKTAYALALIDTIPGIVARLPAPIASTAKTPSELRAESLRAVGLVLVYTPNRNAQTQEQGARSETNAIALEIKKLEYRVAAAASTHDTSQMASLLTDDYLGVLMNGKVINKATTLRLLENSTETAQFRLDAESFDVRVINQGRAIASGVVRWEGILQNGKPFHGALRFTDTWVVRNSRWQRLGSLALALPAR